MAAKELVVEVKKPNGSELAVNSPYRLMELALSNNAAIDVIERLAVLQEKAMTRDAEIQFNEAMNAAQAEIRRVAPDAYNEQTKSKWATYAAIDRAVRPIYTNHGFSLSFDSGISPQADTVIAYCYVSHRAGHTRKYQSPPMPSDGKGAKGGDVMTKTHATGAAMSYGMRYLLKYIFNVAIGADDNDGNGAGGYAELDERLEWLANCKDIAELDGVYKAAYKDARAVNDHRAMKALIDAQRKRRSELV